MKPETAVKYGKGSSQFLAMGAIVLAEADLQSSLSLFSEARTERGHAKTFRKFSENNDKDNFVLTKLLSKKSVRFVAVALHKPSLAGSHIRSNPQKEYQYLVKFTLERISWVARDAARGGHPDQNCCRVFFSEQKTYPYEDLCEYLNKLQHGRDRHNCSVEWAYIDEKIGYAKHKNEDPIHFGDLVASAFHRAIEPKEHEMVDDRFFRNLLPAIYSKNGKRHGLKLFPPRQIDEICARGELSFLKL